MFIERVAEGGIFTVSGRNAIDSVMHSNLYEVFTWVSAQNAKAEYQNNLQKEQQKRR